MQEAAERFARLYRAAVAGGHTTDPFPLQQGFNAAVLKAAEWFSGLYGGHADSLATMSLSGLFPAWMIDRCVEVWVVLMCA